MKKLTRILGGLAIGAAALTTSLAAASPAQAADTEAKLSG
ncbi:hypothetical protein Snas_0310 [Stackebrandtia nassauensis DSM 44728]|uniref:Uncharacterized protein n=1 Tax=Stackebrandtia nassauensis (strain DSM 44728 / CIP 108903 / NRRL B-16338 / NBRC 102104 / LLR-40K-21) TaxID=446470 RepID=D3Q358_STANL|nr:hypothetical protein Snas_0310 [Stackebrandtia nassauensis DSM 44728]